MASRWSTPSATRRDSATRTASCSRARSGGADFVSYRIGFDVGGTFTDFVLQSPAGELTTAKRLTTYPDPSEACLARLDALLAEADARRAIRALVESGVTTLAICLLHAYLNPQHEKRLAALAAAEAPHLTVTLSHEVSPTFREYERTSTTVVNAYVMTAVRDYLRGLGAALGGRGYRGRLFVMQSSGGVATADAMERYPVRMIESGPAAGALMAAAYGELTGHRDLIAFDMGGTTAKLALVENGRPYTTTAFELHRVHGAAGSGLPMNIQAIDLVEIGAGGGSIARAHLGVIAVGPESASSVPGPVCYGRGGIEPTVTDADLVLGYLNADYFAGGSLRLDRDGARRAIATRVAQPLGLAVVRGAAVAGNVTLARSLDARYVGQGYELTVPVPAGRLDAAALARIRAAFDEIYAARYGYANPMEPVETVTWKLAAVGGAPRVALAKAASDGRDGGLKGRRRAWFPETRGWTECAVYDRYALAPGARLDGPAIVEERESTSVLPPGTSATVDEYANLIVEVAR